MEAYYACSFSRMFAFACSFLTVGNDDCIWIKFEAILARIIITDSEFIAVKK